MKLAVALVACGALALGARADQVLTRKTHVDGFSAQGREVPPRDGVQTVWLGQNRMRVDDGERVTIVRLDRSRVWLLDVKAKTSQELELPIDLAKYVPPEGAELFAKMSADVKATLTASDETKTFGTWSARRFSFVVDMPPDQGWTSTVWTSKDVAVDRESFFALMMASASAQIGGTKILTELRKTEGISVRTERLRKIAGVEVRQTEELVSVETKDAPEGTYDVPAGFTAKTFNPLENVMRLAQAAAKQEAEKKAPPK